MTDCADDLFTFSEGSLSATFFDDQFTSVANELALLAMENYEYDDSSSSAESTSMSTSVAGVAVVKSSKKKPVGPKLRSKVYRQREAPINNNVAIKSVQYQKDTKGGKYKFYAFPSFAVSDTMLFLPSAMAAHINSADTASLSRLLLSHFDKECEVKISLLPGHIINTRRFLKFYTVMTDLRPDTIMCVHSTKVEGNQLCASVYVKFTDCKVIYDSVARTVTDPVFRTMFTNSTRRLSYDGSEYDSSDPVCKAASSLVHEEADVVVYVRLDIKLTIDEASKKVTHYDLQGHVTSIKAVDKMEQSLE